MPSAVLVVEDEEEIRDPLIDLIQMAGFPTLVARNGREALEILKTAPAPGMILLDLMMPEMSGTEFLAAIQEHPEFQNIPVVIMTAWLKRMTEVPARANEVLPKPIDSGRLLELIRRYCGGSGGGGPDRRRPDNPPGTPRGRRDRPEPRDMGRRLLHRSRYNATVAVWSRAANVSRRSRAHFARAAR